MARLSVIRRVFTVKSEAISMRFSRRQLRGFGTIRSINEDLKKKKKRRVHGGEGRADEIEKPECDSTRVGSGGIEPNIYPNCNI